MKISGLTKLVLAGAVIVSSMFSNKLNAQVNTSDYNPTPVTQVANWKEGRPYWDMPVDQDQQTLRKSKKTLEYQFNPYHQPNEIYGKETCHGGGDGDGDGDGDGINIGDQNAAQTGAYNFALDVTGNNIVNAEDATEIQNYLDKTITYLQSHWNFLNKDEKLAWFTKMADIYTVNQKQYIDGDETTRYISGNFATEFCIRMQGYNKNLTDILGGTRKDILDKYEEEFNGRGNIPIYFVNRVRFDDNGNVLGGHGMNGLLIGDNPLDINDWIWYEPQLNQIFQPGNLEGIFPANSSINVYKLENFGGSSWGEDMPSGYIGDPQEIMKLLEFDIDSRGNSSVYWNNPNLLTTKPTVSIGKESNIPDSYLLGNNYPDPFNSNTKIPYEVHKRTKMSLDLYDIRGRHIKNLEKGIKEPNQYIEDLNMPNLPSNTYFIRFTTPEGHQSKRISLVK